MLNNININARIFNISVDLNFIINNNINNN